VQQPIPTLTASNVGRAALAAYLKTLAGAVAADGVTVNMVLPGRIATDRLASLDRAAAERTGRSVEDTAAASRAAIPTGRYGDPAEFGAVVAFLASAQAAYVTGEQVRVDGGLVGGY
jgi:3-oxoacyl-[acyl-carrier protein] reductase